MDDWYYSKSQARWIWIGNGPQTGSPPNGGQPPADPSAKPVLSYEQQMQLNGFAPDGQGGWYRLPSSSSSSSTSQSFADPAQLAQQNAQFQQQQQQAWAVQLAQQAHDQQTARERAQLDRDLAAASQAFQAQQDYRQQLATLAQMGAQQTFTANESDIDRAIRNSEFAYSTAAQAAQITLAWQAQVQAARDSYEARRATNRAQLADYISSPNTAALAAFMGLGGGNLSNSLESHQNLLTDATLLPAASALVGLNEQFTPPAMPSLPTYTPPNIPARQPFQMPQLPFAPPSAMGAPAPQLGGGNAFNIPTNNPSGTQLAPTGFTPGIDSNGNLTATPMAAEGGHFNTNQVIVGDSKNGKPNPELVTRTRDGFEIFPLGKLSQEARDRLLLRGWPIPKMADGGVVDTEFTAMPVTGAPGAPAPATYSSVFADPNQAAPGTAAASPLSPELQSAIDTIRRWRSTYAPVDLRRLGVESRFDPRYRLLSPALREQYELSQQVVSGVPASEYANEASQYALAPIRRSPLFPSVDMRI